MSTTAEIMERLRIEVDTYGNGYHTDANGWEHHRYDIRISTERTRLDDPDLGILAPVPWRQGLGIDEEPAPADVLAALVRDGAGTAAPFEEWAAEYGYDTDSLRAFRTYETCQQVRAWLVDLLGEDTLAELEAADDDA